MDFELLLDLNYYDWLGRFWSYVWFPYDNTFPLPVDTMNEKNCGSAPESQTQILAEEANLTSKRVVELRIN